jgi:hypothetical protein
VSLHDGRPAPPPLVEGGAERRPGGTTPDLAIALYERARAADLGVLRRWKPPGRLPDSLWTAAWNPDTGEQVTVVWSCSIEEPFRWRFDRLVHVPDNRLPRPRHVFDDGEVTATIEEFLSP